MDDGLGRIQNVLVLGGTSEIGCAIADALLPHPGSVILAGRHPAGLAAAGTRISRPGRDVATLHYDATASAAATINVLSAAAARKGDLDAVILCVGELTDETTLADDSVATEAALRTSMLGPMIAVHASVARLRAQGHGTLVVLSSVAAVRTRQGLLTYGVAKSALDLYARRIGDVARSSGVRVLVVRPGHVRTRMTAGLPEQVLTIEAQDVAVRVWTALRRGSRVVYAPALLRPVVAILRLLPTPVFRWLSSAGNASTRTMAATSK
jgi:decaprenylphospho-beta-D-erythro-pentofuranosid-2-ulose 2-reductase